MAACLRCKNRVFSPTFPFPGGRENMYLADHPSLPMESAKKGNLWGFVSARGRGGGGGHGRPCSLTCGRCGNEMV